MSAIPVNATNAAEAAHAVRDGATRGPSTVRRSTTIAKLAVALCAVQSEVQNPTKNKQNPHLKNWYADLSAVLGVTMPVLNKYKLTLVQLPCELDGEAAMTTLLLHESGEWLETVTKLRPVKSDPQGIGSAQTYCRRYCLQSIAGITAEDDDDGNAATHRPERREQPAAKPANGKPAPMTLPQLIGAIKVKQPPADGAELSSRVGWLAVQFGRLIPAFDPADLDAAIGDALDLSESWKYETLPADAVRRAWRVVVDYAAKSHQPAGVS